MLNIIYNRMKKEKFLYLMKQGTEVLLKDRIFNNKK
jgi:hypothetical protein